jgi:hypothetical protein
MRPAAELLEQYEEWAVSATSWAATHRDNRNWPMALQNYDEAAKNRFFRSLVGWRTGLLSPVPELLATLDVSEEAVAFLSTTNVGPLRQMFDPVPGAYSAILLDQPASAVVAETRRLAVRSTPRGVTVDRTVEAWLIGVLVGHHQGAGADLVAELKGGKRTKLVGETYATYFELAALDRNSLSEAVRLTRHALELFRSREQDPYYSGGVQYEGGDTYNVVVIDFHLAAIWHVRGWDPSELTSDERLHVRLPT